MVKASEYKERERGIERERASEREQERESARSLSREAKRISSMPDRKRMHANTTESMQARRTRMQEKALEKYMTSRNGVQASEQQDALAPTVLFSLLTFTSPVAASTLCPD